ncbi:MAG: ABC transporter ATP-binding protein [Planctomycetota bacterium]|jgi:ABC-2 type transport system ATP-binding protein
MDEPTQTPLIEMEDLTIRYGALTALDRVSAIIPGGAVGLLGPNGAGKSTLVKSLLGLLKLHGGAGRLMGMDVTRFGLEIRRSVGYMPERDCYIPGMNGFEYVAFCGRLVGMPPKDARQRAHEVLEYVGLGEARYRLVDGYSTGMRQRVKLAQALIHDPKFIILDEPTNGFDPKGREDVLELIHDVSHRKDMHLLLSSHLLRDVERTCDAVLLLKDGEVKQYGMIRQLKQMDGRVFELEIRGEMTRFKETVTQRGWRIEGGERNRVRLHLPVDGETRNVFLAAREADVQIRSLFPCEESLEDLFLKSIEE